MTNDTRYYKPVKSGNLLHILNYSEDIQYFKKTNVRESSKTQPPLATLDSAVFYYDFAGLPSGRSVSTPKITRFATAASPHPALLDRKRCFLAMNASGLAKHAVVQACDSGDRP